MTFFARKENKKGPETRKLSYLGSKCNFIIHLRGHFIDLRTTNRICKARKLCSATVMSGLEHSITNSNNNKNLHFLNFYLFKIVLVLAGLFIEV